MTATSRRVRRLRLSAPDPGLIQHGAALFEDALRIADLPAADGGRLLLIRELEVGAFAPAGGAGPLARVLSDAVRKRSSEAVHGGAPGASSAAAVYFHDRAEAGTLLARRLATSGGADAWFWELAVPEWRRGLDRHTALRAVLLATLEIPGGVATASRLVAELAASGNLTPLLRALRPADGDRLLGACGWSRRPRRGGDGRTPVGGASTPRGFRGALEQALEAWGGEDERLLWLACALMVGATPDLALDRRLPLRARQVMAAAELRPQPPRRPLPSGAERTATRRPRPPRGEGQATAGGGQPDTPAGPDRSGSLEVAGSHRPAPASAPAGIPGSDRRARFAVPEVAENSVETSVSRNLRSREEPPRRPASLPAREPARPLDAGSAARTAASQEPAETAPDLSSNKGARSDFAGLLFLLPVLRQLGIESFLEAHPELIAWSIPARLLRLVARRLTAPEGDALLAALSPAKPPTEPARLDFTTPLDWRRRVIAPGQTSWRFLTKAAPGPAAAARPGTPPANARVLVDASSRLTLAMRGGRLPEHLDLALAAWLIAARRWCRRRAGLGLASLVRRAGRVLATPTHIDVILDYRQADARIRRAGLDQDPGWLPWLGRVVKIHYRNEEDLGD